MLTKATGLALALICASATPNVLYAADGPGSVDGKPPRISPAVVSDFFDTTPEADRFVWVPQRQGLSRYGFTIPREGFRRAEIYQDTSDLFYLSDLRDFGLAAGDAASLSWMAVLAKDSVALGVEGSVAPSYRVGLRVQSSGGAEIQGVLRRQLVVSDQTVVGLSAEIGSSRPLRLVGEAVTLAANERSELFANFAVEAGGGLLWGEVGKTWFDVWGNLDLSASTYAHAGDTQGLVMFDYGRSSYKMSFGVQEVFSSSPSLVLELAVQPKRQGALQSEIVVRNSGLEDSRLSFQRQSLKSFRRVEMAQVWREGLGFERNK
ncbi:hypothetical protein N9R76_02925 [Planktomarina temperata]|nr:hypothetical protein [Planktomarina temperata]